MAKKNLSFFTEFKSFISRGNVVDMAVGVVVGTAFTAIVNSLVKDMIMPLIGWLVGGINFADLKLVLAPAVGEVPEVAVLYGVFLNQVINFLILAFVVFCMVKLMGKLRRKREETPAAPATPPADVILLTEIRDLLKESQITQEAEKIH